MRTGVFNLLADARRSSLQNSLSEFVQSAWGVLESQPLIWSWHLDAICDHLQAVADGQIQRLIINVPPGHMKSLLTSVFFPAWMWTRRPTWKVLGASYAHELALRDSVRCRRLIESDWYRKTMIPDWRLTEDQNRKGIFENTRGGVRQAISVGGAVTGFRGNCIICDDPMNAMDRYSEAARREVKTWWDSAVSSRLNDPRVDSRVVIMQRLHEDDLTGHLLRQGGYDHLCLPSEWEPPGCRTSIGWQDPRCRPGELLFPDIYDSEVLDQARRELGSLDYACQHMQQPVPAEGVIFKADWFTRRYDRLPQLREVWSAWDTAMKTGQANDESARVTVGLGADGDLYVLDMDHGRWETPVLAERLVGAARRWRDLYPRAYRGDYIEDTGAGTVLMQYLRQDAPDVVTIPLRPDKDKQARASAVAPFVESGRFRLPDEVAYPDRREWVSELIRDLLTFPAGRHDDIVDSVVYAILVLVTRSRVRPGLFGGAAVAR